MNVRNFEVFLELRRDPDPRCELKIKHSAVDRMANTATKTEHVLFVNLMAKRNNNKNIRRNESILSDF